MDPKLFSLVKTFDNADEEVIAQYVQDQLQIMDNGEKIVGS